MNLFHFIFGLKKNNSPRTSLFSSRYPDDVVCQASETQILWGDALMIAPVLEKVQFYSNWFCSTVLRDVILLN